jgi:predicted permease
MVERILGIILPVFSVILLGYFYARRANPDMTWVNRINMHVLAPALIFSALASKDFDLVANRVLIVGAIGWCSARACSRGPSRGCCTRIRALSCRR